jgi:hypothetical protein
MDRKNWTEHEEETWFEKLYKLISP